MNDGLCVFLHLDEKQPEENEKLFERIDELLLTVGMKYCGVGNMYIPVHTEERDRAVFLAVQLLRETEWLKDILAAIPIASLKDVCPLDSILTENMTEPDKEKMRYYEEYYNASHKLPHAIIIDETKQLRDGYISYLLARKYKLKPDLYEAFSNQPLKKLVIGTHVKFCDGKWKRKGRRKYSWIYTKKHPVVPGDILQVNTKHGLDFMCVEKIDYVTGREFCRTYKRVKRHMDMRIEL